MVRQLQHHGVAAWLFWSSFGKTRMSSSLLSAGCFQDLLQPVRIAVTEIL